MKNLLPILFCFVFFTLSNNLFSQNRKILVWNENITKSLQDAINSDFDTIIIPDNKKIWKTGPISISKKNGLTIILEKNLVLEAIDHLFFNLELPLITISNSTNIRIISEELSTVKMDTTLFNELCKKANQSSEHRHIISIVDGSNKINIKNLKLEGAAGDGIYIGTSNGGLTNLKSPKNITIDNVNSNFSARNGLSIVTGENIYIKNSIFQNTNFNNNYSSCISANGPFAGIDIEPNKIEDKLKNINIWNCKFYNNFYSGIEINFAHYETDSELSVNIIDSFFKTKGFDGSPKNFGIYMRELNKSNDTVTSKIKNINIEGCYIETLSNSGIDISSWRLNKNINVQIKNSIIFKKKDTTTFPITIYNNINTNTGNIYFDNVYSLGPINNGQQPIGLGINGSGSFININGIIHTNFNKDSIRYQLMANSINDNLFIRKMNVEKNKNLLENIPKLKVNDSDLFLKWLNLLRDLN